MNIRQAFEQWASMPDTSTLAAKSYDAFKRVILKKYANIEVVDFTVNFVRRLYFECLERQELKTKSASVLVYVLEWASQQGECKPPLFTFDIANSHDRPEVKSRGQHPRPVVQIDPVTLKPMRTWDSMMDVRHELGIININRAIQRHSMAGGYYWADPDGVSGFRPKPAGKSISAAAVKTLSKTPPPAPKPEPKPSTISPQPSAIKHQPEPKPKPDPSALSPHCVPHSDLQVREPSALIPQPEPKPEPSTLSPHCVPHSDLQVREPSDLSPQLADYSDRELAEELHRRGWHVELTKSIVL